MDWWADEPVLVSMINHGCTQVNAMMAYYVHEHLIQTCWYFDVEYQHSDDFTILYLTARRMVNRPAEAFYPAAIHLDITYEHLCYLTSNIPYNRFHIAALSESRVVSIHLVIQRQVHHDSPVEFYVQRIMRW